MCTFKKAIKNVEDVPRRILGFKAKFGNRHVSSIQSTCSFLVVIVVLNDYLVHSCWGLDLGSRFLQIERLMECLWLP